MIDMEKIKEMWQSREHPDVTSPEHEAMRQLIGEVERLEKVNDSLALYYSMANIAYSYVYLQPDHPLYNTIRNDLIMYLEALKNPEKKITYRDMGVDFTVNNPIQPTYEGRDGIAVPPPENEIQYKVYGSVESSAKIRQLEEENEALKKIYEAAKKANSIVDPRTGGYRIIGIEKLGEALQEYERGK